MGTACRIVASLVVACAVAIVGTPSGAQSTRALTVTPDTNLVDGDVVALHGTGFTPSSTVFFCQGVEEGTPGQEDCGVPFQSATADATGEFDATYTVRRFITPPSVGAEIDCAQPSANCRFGASDSIFPTADTVAFAPIAFAPQPPRTVTVTPDTDLVDGDVVALGGSGFTPGDTINFCQGVQAGQPGAPCGAPELSAQVDATGEFAASYTVRRFISRNPGVMMDCAAPLANCTLIFFTLGGGFARRVPITFAPQAPVPQISGIVTDPQGAPVPGVDVWAYTPSDTWVGSLQTVTDAQGSYEFAQVEPGVEYRILFRSAAGSGLASEWFDDRPNRQGAAGITLSDAEFVEANAQLDQAGAMSGSVTDANGNPASGVQVLVFCPGDTWVGSYGSSTASDGTYAIGDLRPADCRVVFVPPAGSGLATEWFDDAPTRSLATDVTVSPAQTVVGIDAQLDETGAISGSVTDANGNPVSGVEVWAFDPGDGFFGFDGTSTASDGGYAIGNLRPANYRVVFRPPTESGLAPEWFDDAANRSLATDITVSPGQTVAGVDAQLANRP